MPVFLETPTHTHIHTLREVQQTHHWDEVEEGGKKMRRGRSGPECRLVLPRGNDGTSVTQMTVRVAGLFARPPVRCDGLDRQSGWRLRGNDRLHFHLGEKSD